MLPVETAPERGKLYQNHPIPSTPSRHRGDVQPEMSIVVELIQPGVWAAHPFSSNQRKKFPVINPRSRMQL